jgi:hypothetical protein
MVTGTMSNKIRKARHALIIYEQMFSETKNSEE